MMILPRRDRFQRHRSGGTSRGLTGITIEVPSIESEYSSADHTVDDDISVLSNCTGAYSSGHAAGRNGGAEVRIGSDP